MAERKQNVLVKKDSGGSWLTVWCDNPRSDILEIEGVASVTGEAPNYTVWIDPRYDMDEVAEEIRQRFDAPLPDVFKEAFE